jgi:hypothetical protein
MLAQINTHEKRPTSPAYSTGKRQLLIPAVSFQKTLPPSTTFSAPHVLSEQSTYLPVNGRSYVGSDGLTITVIT